MLSEPTARDTRYPKVLIVALSRVNRRDTCSGAFLLRNLFGAWPRERLAQIYSSGDQGDAGFCGAYYRLGPDDRTLGSVFYRGRSRLGFPDTDKAMQPAAARATAQSATLKRIRLGVASAIASGQLYELVFRTKISAAMADWVRAIAPDVIYANGYTLGFTRLPVLIARKFDLPLCIHWSDDWPGALQTAVSPPVWRHLLEPQVQALVRQARLRWAFSSMMAAEYRQRYGVDFDVVMNGDDPARFPAPSEVTGARAFSIVIAGNLLGNRWRAVVDWCAACEELQAEGLDVRITAYTTNLPPEAHTAFARFPNLQIMPAPSHDELPARLAAADILGIVESFDPKRASDIRFSVSTKAHLYMLARRPILVYAPEITGIAQYAQTEDFALVVNAQDKQQLKETTRNLLLDSALRAALIAKGWSVALRNHDIERTRRRVHDTLSLRSGT